MPRSSYANEKRDLELEAAYLPNVIMENIGEFANSIALAFKLHDGKVLPSSAGAASASGAETSGVSGINCSPDIVSEVVFTKKKV